MHQLATTQLDTWLCQLRKTFQEGYQPIGVVLYAPTKPASLCVDFYTPSLAAMAGLPGATIPNPDEALQDVSLQPQQAVGSGTTPLAVMLANICHPTLSICDYRFGLQQSGVHSSEAAAVATLAWEALPGDEELREPFTPFDETAESVLLPWPAHTPTAIH